MHKAFISIAALLASSALAQDMGLDLSEAKTPAEFKPSIGFIGVTPAELDSGLSGRAKLLEPELLNALVATEQFSVVKTPVAAAEVSADARKCFDFACLDALAQKMGVDRLVTATLAKAGPGTVLMIYGFDSTLPSVLPASVESQEKNEKAAMGGFSGLAGKSQAQRDKDFIIRAKPVFNELVKSLETPLGKISIDVIDQKAVTTIRGKEVGVGNFEKAYAAGSYDISVGTGDYLPFTATVVIEPQKVAQVKVTLVAKPVERAPEPVVVVETGNPVYRRPGLYLAAAGLIAMAVGFGFGAAAGGIERQSTHINGDGTVNITRAQAMSARTDALLANILITVGAVALAGGVVWAFVLPMIGPKKPVATPPPPGPNEGEGSGFGFTAGVGVHF